MFNGKFDNDEKRYFKIRNSLLVTDRIEVISKFIKPKTIHEEIFEIGSGTGNLILELAIKYPNKNFVGMDPLKNYVKHCIQESKNRKIYNVAFINDRVENLDKYNQLNQKISTILTVDTLHHIEDLNIALTRISPISKRKTLWVIIEPNVHNLYIRLYHYLKSGEKNFHQEEFIKKASKNNWTLVTKKYFYLIPIKFRKFRILEIIEKKFKVPRFMAGSVLIVLERN
ncbi:hypothetical protein GM51_4790 [freshwater metagenome]|uniref:Methyltransferase domain-containing protein n=1 Tax=freshwater metagenome TaxID=449393 RepID=A0A094SQC4_9ZZZZ